MKTNQIKQKSRKMEIFKFLQKKIATVGFIPNKQQKNYEKSKRGQIIYIIVCGLNTIVFLFYIFLVANDIEEYMNAIFLLTAVITVTIAFTNLMFRNNDIFNVIEFCAKEQTESTYTY